MADFTQQDALQRLQEVGMTPEEAQEFFDQKKGFTPRAGGSYLEPFLRGTYITDAKLNMLEKEGSAQTPLAQAIMGRVAPQARQQGRESQLLGKAPTLQHYAGPTQVSLTPQEQSTIGLINQLLQGDVGNLQQQLFGNLETILGRGRQELTQQILPQIGEQFSGGPRGSAFHSGARQGAQERAIQDFAGRAAEMRAAQPARLLGEAIQALPSLGTERLQAVDNLNRAISTHYQNQGLTQQEFLNDLAAVDQAFRESMGYQGLDLQRQQLEAQQAQADFEKEMAIMGLREQLEQQRAADKAGFFGGFGTLAGLGAGALIPGLSPLLGSVIGGGTGTMLGGAPALGMSQIGGGLTNQFLMQQLLGGGGGLWGPGPTVPSNLTTSQIMNLPSRYTVAP